MIIGIGIDLTEVARIRSALDNPRTGSRFRDRVFTAGEIAYCEKRRNAAESYAARFAAKEATVKAFGEFMAWCDIEVVRDDGAPELRLSGKAGEHARARGVTRLHLSLTHTSTIAAAYVIAES